MMKLSRLRCALAAMFLFSASLTEAQPPTNQKPFKPTDNDAAVKQLATFRVPEGFKVELFAAEPQLGSPVAFCLDERGRVFVAEEYRFNRGTEENRTRPFLLDDDLQIKTLDDRLATVTKFADRFEGGAKWFTKHADQVRRLVQRFGQRLDVIELELCAQGAAVENLKGGDLRLMLIDVVSERLQETGGLFFGGVVEPLA